MLHAVTRRKTLLMAAILLVAALVVEAWGPTPRVDGRVFNRHQNGLWLGHRWFDGRAGPSELSALVPEVRDSGIRDLYIHVGPLNAQGDIPSWSPTACRARLQSLRQALPGVRVYAWLGGVTTDLYGVAPDTVDLTSTVTRARVIQTASALLEQAGFDGIHYDLELIPNHTQGFLDLLAATRSRLPHMSLSVATPILHVPWLPMFHAWSPDYLHQVASHCDQIAVMSYDTSMQTETLYKRLLAWEVPHICQAVAGTPCQVLLGVPTYHDRTFMHNPRAETERAALDGIAWGLSKSGSVVFQGIAVYAQWTTTPAEWTDLSTRWNGR